MRPLEDRVQGLDEILCKTDTTEIDNEAMVAVRVAVGMFVKKHGEVLEYFEQGGQEALVVASGIVYTWNDHIQVEDTLVKHGQELPPVAHSVLVDLADGCSDKALATDSQVEVNNISVSKLAEGIEKLLPKLRLGEDDFKTCVLVEMLEALLTQHMEQALL